MVLDAALAGVARGHAIAAIIEDTTGEECRGIRSSCLVIVCLLSELCLNSLEQVIVDNGCLFPLEDLPLEGNLANVEAIAQQVCERNRASQATPTDRADADSPGRKIAAGESLARDRFDSDCVLGTQFESSQPDQSLTIPQRFPGAAPNTPEMALIAGSTRSLDSAELPRRRFRPFCLCIKKIDFPGKRRPTRKRQSFNPQRHGAVRFRPADHELRRRVGRAGQVPDARHGRDQKPRPPLWC